MADTNNHEHPLSLMQGPALTSAMFSYYVCTEHPAIISRMSDWILFRQGISVAGIGLAAMVGILMISIGRRGSVLYAIASAVSDRVLRKYASALGTVPGWALGMSLAAMATGHQPRDWVLGIVLSLLLTAYVVIPILIVRDLQKHMREFSERWFRNRLSQAVIRIAGWVVLFAAVVWTITAGHSN